MSDKPWNATKIDFSLFHPVDHRPFTKRCRSLPGGSRNHLKLSWQWIWKQRLRIFIHQYFLCYFGFHFMGESWDPRAKRRFEFCWGCNEKRRRLPWEE